MAVATDIEKENLEAHVELCAQRYDALDRRLSAIEDKVGKLQSTIEKSHGDTMKVMIGTAGTVLVGIIGLIVTILNKAS